MADDGKKNATNTRSEAREKRLLKYLGKIGIPENTASKIDINALHESIDDIRKATEVQRNTWALNCIQGYDVAKIAPVGMEILTYFQEDFAEWTVDDFRQLDRHIRRALQSQLVSKGIYLGKANAPISNRLADLLRMTEVPKWDERMTEVPEWDEDDLLATETLNPTGQSEVRTMSQSSSPAPEPNLLQPSERPQTFQPQTNWQPTRASSPQPMPYGHGGYSDALAYRCLPPAKVEEEPLLPHLVERFINIWDKDMNYTGDPCDWGGFLFLSFPLGLSHLCLPAPD